MGVISAKEKCYLCGKEKVKIARLNYLGRGRKNRFAKTALLQCIQRNDYNEPREDLIILKRFE